MTRVLTTSTGDVVTAEQNPAIIEAVICSGIPSVIKFMLRITCLAWS